MTPQRQQWDIRLTGGDVWWSLELIRSQQASAKEVRCVVVVGAHSRGPPLFLSLGPSWFLAGFTTFYHWGEENVSTWETVVGME